MKLKSVLYLLTLNILLVLQSPSTVKAQTWENDMGGCGEDIAAASSLSAWVLGCSDYIGGGFEIWRWNGTQWISTGGRGKRIAVSPDGIPWVVAKDGTIWRYRQSDASWQPVDGCARDIGVGNNNSVWIVGCTVGRNGYHIRKWTGTGWQTLGDAGMEIAVSPSGIPWVVAADGAIFKRNGNTWERVDGCAKDIGVGNNNSIWVLGCQPGGNDGYHIRKWTGTGWQTLGRGGRRISVSPGGVPWIVGVAKENNIWRFYNPDPDEPI